MGPVLLVLSQKEKRRKKDGWRKEMTMMTMTRRNQGMEKEKKQKWRIKRKLKRCDIIISSDWIGSDWIGNLDLDFTVTYLWQTNTPLDSSQTVPEVKPKNRLFDENMDEDESECE